MKKPRFTEQQIAQAVRQAKQGAPTPGLITSRAFARRLDSADMVALRGLARVGHARCQEVRTPCSRHSGARWKAMVSLHL
jgi:hypothetical protein